MYEPPVQRVRVVSPIVLLDDGRAPAALLAANRRDGLPCWDPLLAAWSERAALTAAIHPAVDLRIASASRLVVATTQQIAPQAPEHAALDRLVAEGARAVVVVVRDAQLVPSPDDCFVDADAWEIALAERFERVCTRRFLWSAAVSDEAWLADLVSASLLKAKPADVAIEPARPSWDTVWLGGAVFAGVRSRRT